MDRYQFLDHPADIKLRVFGKDLPDVFINAAIGMMSFLFPQAGSAITKSTKEITVEAEGLDSLLVNWLSEILWLCTTLHSKGVDFQIQKFSEHKLSAKIVFTSAVAQDEIKAVTYHELKIVQENKHWLAEVVFDI